MLDKFWKFTNSVKGINTKFKLSLWLFVFIAFLGFDKFSFYSLNKKTDLGVLSIYEAVGIFIFLNIVLLLDYVANEKNKNWTFKILILLLSIFFVALFTDLLSGIFKFAHIYYVRENLFSVLLSLFALLSINRIFKKIRILNNFEPPKGLYFLIYFSLLFFVLVVNPTILYNSAADDFSLSSGVLLVKMFLVFLSGISVVTFFYFISSKILRNVLIFLGSFLLFSSLLYSFVIVKNYGLLDHFIFHAPEKLFVPKAQIFLEIIGLIAFAYFINLLLIRRPQVFKKIYIAILVMLVSFFVFNIPQKTLSKHQQDNSTLPNKPKQETFNLENEKKTLLSFSKEKNILVIFLDAFSGGDMRTIVDEKKYIFQDYNGFVWYKNTLSTGTNTKRSIAAMFGGHNYTIENINSRINKGSKKTLREELDEAYGIFPKSFIPNNWQVSYLHPQYAKNIDKGVYVSSFKYGDYYLSRHGVNEQELNLNKINLEKNMLYILSVFKISPLFIKKAIYDEGKWNGLYETSSKAVANIHYKANSWGFLNSLVEFANAENPKKTLKYIQLDIPHGPHAVAPDGTLSIDKSSYHIEAYKSLEKIGELIRKLKEQDIYDNTKIILVADHGYWWRPNINFESTFDEKVPEGNDGSMHKGLVHPLLMVKDFNEKGNFRISNRFMSNADVPSIVCSTLENHCSITDLDPTKHNLQRKLTITSASVEFDEDKEYNIILQYQVKDNIFDPNNWKRIK